MIMNADVAAIVDCLEFRDLMQSGDLAAEDPGVREGARAKARSIARRERIERVSKVLDTYQKTKHAVDGAALWSEVQEALQQP